MILHAADCKMRIKNRTVGGSGNGASGTALIHMSAEEALAYGLIDKIIDKR